MPSAIRPLDDTPERRRGNAAGQSPGPFEGAYTGRGAIGQWITVLPAVDLVIAHKTNSVYGRTTSWASWQRMLELLLDAKGVGVEAWPWG